MTLMVPNRITIHCTDTPNNKSVSIEHITADHIAKGYGGIGYHVVIQPDGFVHWTKPLNEVGAHVGLSNTGNIGIALAGCDRFSYAQFNALKDAMNSIRQSYPTIEPWMVFCHYEFPSAQLQGKNCPNLAHHQILGWYCGHNDNAIDGYLIEKDKRYTIP